MVIVSRYLNEVLLIVAAQILFKHFVIAQVTLPIQTQLETGGFASSNETTPFWLRANQYGTVPLETPVVTFRFLVAKAYAPKDTTKPRANRFGWGVGLYPVVNAGVTNQFLLPEAYGKVKYGAIELWVGRRRNLTGLGDSVLSSGFLIGSGNALPIPKLQLATVGYAPLKFLGSFIAINAGYAHGWFTSTYIKQSYLHHKYMYWRFGKPKATIKVHLGMNHQAQWGGHADYLLGNPLAVNGKLPSAFKYYGNIILATRPLETITDDYTDFDGSYRIGNHVGGHDLGVEIMTRRETILLYYQHPFDDASGLLFQNTPDGLMGLSWQRHLSKTSKAFQLNRMVLELLSTLNQSGSTFWLPNSNFQGADNYFNHSQYREGWSYQGRAIGTPFIAPQKEFRPEINQPAQAFFLTTASGCGTLVQKVISQTACFGWPDSPTVVTTAPSIIRSTAPVIKLRSCSRQMCTWPTQTKPVCVLPLPSTGGRSTPKQLGCQ